jgi:hypothetical protein
MLRDESKISSTVHQANKAAALKTSQTVKPVSDGLLLDRVDKAELQGIVEKAIENVPIPPAYESPIVIGAVIAATAAITAALIARRAANVASDTARRNALIQAVIAQRMKRADFRQAWINELRKDFAKVLGHFFRNDVSAGDFHYMAANTLLMLNREDPDFENYRKTSSAIYVALEAGKDLPKEQMKELTATTQRILKREWEVTKQDIGLLEEDIRKL